jgi:hypothetical protein
LQERQKLPQQQIKLTRGHWVFLTVVSSLSDWAKSLDLPATRNTNRGGVDCIHSLPHVLIERKKGYRGTKGEKFSFRA